MLSVIDPPAAGTVTVAVDVPQAEVTVTVYVPAHNPVAVWPVCTGTVFQL